MEQASQGRQSGRLFSPDARLAQPFSTGVSVADGREHPEAKHHVQQRGQVPLLNVVLVSHLLVLVTFLHQLDVPDEGGYSGG